MREYFSGGITMTVTDGCFRLSTDSMVLADFCRLPRGAAVCDLGSGCGALGLLLLRDHPDMRVTGLEILPVRKLNNAGQGRASRPPHHQLPYSPYHYAGPYGHARRARPAQRHFRAVCFTEFL